MAFRKKRVFKKRRVVKRKSYARKKAAPLRKMIKKEIARNIEDKTQSVLNLGLTLTSVNNLSFNTRNVVDVGVSAAAVSITQGTGQGNRVGNRIKIKKHVFKGTLVPLGYTANNTVPRPMQVKMWIFYDKENPSGTPNPYADFFQNGNSINPFQNDLTDQWLPVNQDKYRVLTTRTFKLGHASYGQSNNLVYPTMAVSPYGGYNNNDFKYNANFSIDLTKYMVKNVAFRDGNVDPTTRGLFALFSYACADGEQYAPSTEALMLQYMVDCKYEDA